MRNRIPSYWIQWVLLIALMALFVLKALWIPWNKIGHDFPNYYGSSRLLVNQEVSIKWYDYDWFNIRLQHMGLAGGSFSQFPPVTAYIMVPLQFFEALTAFRLWLCINLLLLIGITIALSLETNAPLKDISLIFLLSGFGLINNFAIGQFYIVLLSLMVTGYMLETRNHSVVAGICLGAGMVVKYVPLLLVLLYCIHRRWKLVWAAVASAIAIKLSELLFFSWDAFSYYLLKTFPDHVAGQMAIQSSHSHAFQSIDALLLNWFVPHATSGTDVWLAEPTLYPVIKTIVISAIVGISIWIVVRVQRSKLHERLPLQIALALITVLLIVPASATYHFVLLSLPAIFIWVYVPRARFIRSVQAIFVCYTLIGLLPIHRIIQWDFDGFWTVLKYPRLICLGIIFCILTTILIRMSSKTTVPAEP